jgi:hypothetical protein
MIAALISLDIAGANVIKVSKEDLSPKEGGGLLNH